jgi:hypothetical protein|tara:strand:+ start:163 stop:282 length:120 start_codon:yes stop_codon:yes gene_type:complete
MSTLITAGAGFVGLEAERQLLGAGQMRLATAPRPDTQEK